MADLADLHSITKNYLAEHLSARRRPSRTRLSRAIGRFAVVISVVGLGAALPTTASAQIVLSDPCKKALPHATLSLPAQPGSSVSAMSQGGSYFYSPHQECFRFIVDVGVPAGQKVTLQGRYADSASGPMGLIGGVPLSKPDCQNYVQYVTVYRKASFPFPGQFTSQALTRFKGVWKPTIDIPPFYSPAHCELAWAAGDPVSELEHHTTSVFAAKFRVVVAAKSTTWKQVKVTAST